MYGVRLSYLWFVFLSVCVSVDAVAVGFYREIESEALAQDD